MRKSKWLAVVTVVVWAVVFSGCATIVDSGPDKFAIESDPSGAEIFLDGAKVGETPATIEVSRKRSGEFRLEKRGYETVMVRKDKEFNKWVLGNACILSWWGLAIDVFSNNFKKFDGRPIEVRLTPERKDETDDDVERVKMTTSPKPEPHE